MARNEFSWMQQHVSNDEWCSTRRSNNMGTSVVTYVNTYIKHIAAYNRISTRKSQLKLLKICQPQISTKTCSHVEVIMHRCAVKIVTGELGHWEHALDLSIPNSSHCQTLVRPTLHLGCDWMGNKEVHTWQMLTPNPLPVSTKNKSPKVMYA